MNASNAPTASRRSAFTLVEILMVVTLILFLCTLAAPAISNLARAGSVTYAGGELSALLENARATATAQKNYLWLGFAPFPTDHPDQLALALFISRDGTPACTADNLRLLDRIPVFNQIALAADLPGFGNRPTSNPDGTPIYQLPIPSGTPVPWSVPGQGTLNFSPVLEFAPDGSVKANGQLRRRAEFGIVQATDRSKADAVAFQIEGLTGRSHVYRP